LGFGAPPLSGLALVPLAVLQALATSLAALPIFGGVCGAVAVVALDRTLARCGLRALRRVPLVAAFALNPLVAFQFTTGTPAALELALLAVALRGLVGWANHADPRALLGAGAAFAAAVLTRYELAAWALVAGLLVAAALAARGAPRVRRRRGRPRPAGRRAAAAARVARRGGVGAARGGGAAPAAVGRDPRPARRRRRDGAARGGALPLPERRAGLGARAAHRR